MPPEVIVAGVQLVVVVPLLVELGKRELGLPSRFAGVASVGVSAALLGLLELEKRPDVGGWATWALLSIVYGLAASGAYSQAKKLTERQ